MKTIALAAYGLIVALAMSTAWGWYGAAAGSCWSRYDGHAMSCEAHDARVEFPVLRAGDDFCASANTGLRVPCR